MRGGAVFAIKLCTELSQTNTRIHSLFTGHIGCGKSSELQHLADEMSGKSQRLGQKRFFPIIVNMSEYLDENDVSTTDILLAVVAELADSLREREGIELADSFLKRRWDEVKDYLGSDVEINEGELTWGWGKAKVQRLRTDPTAREKIRKVLLPQTSSLLNEINLAFVDARTKLIKASPKDGGQSFSDFVLILDNLEKIHRFAGNAPGDASQRALFIEGAPQLTALDAHVVFTVPLSLVRSDGSLLTQRYSKELFVLPMVKTELRGRSHEPFDKGREKLAEILGRRVPSGFSPLTLFEENALNFLIEYSAGHVRNLMMYARESTLYANGVLPIKLDAVRRAIAQTVSILAPSVRPKDWELLAELELSERQTWSDSGVDHHRLLENLCVMEYINGGDADTFDEAVPWYAVNPVLRVLRLFKDAVKAVEEHSE